MRLLERIYKYCYSYCRSGAISDSVGSLQTALQITWVFFLLSGAIWFAGYYYLSPLTDDVDADVPVPFDGVSYADLLCCRDPLILIDGHIYRRDEVQTHII